jgi:DNA gyrase subunit B
VRHGCPLDLYLDEHAKNKGELPKYVAKIRTGNDEVFRFLHGSEELADFYKEMSTDDTTLSSFSKEIEEDGQKLAQRVKVAEIYEAAEMGKILAEIKKLGLDIQSFTPTEKALYHLLENVAEGKKGECIEIFSILEIIRRIREIGKKGLSIQRYKGLGEMNAQQLFETTMNPRTRSLLRVDISDAVKAEHIFTMLMGEDVASRRAFIEDNALNTSYLDV